eukprot:5920194-Amphidinium_carterae.1
MRLVTPAPFYGEIHGERCTWLCQQWPNMDAVSQSMCVELGVIRFKLNFFFLECMFVLEIALSLVTK